MTKKVDEASVAHATFPNQEAHRSLLYLKDAVFSWMSDTSNHSENSSLVNLMEVEFNLLTGRTHQIRGQVSALGEDYHIAGDNLYSGASTSDAATNYPGASPFLALQVRSERSHSHTISSLILISI